mmetsp:Transcript_4434/g.17455  ORF Transcript_4434/g.17455 Transcript_4434/m.17455 type:complete len:95 (-) Transcript_4434:1183-1467(-)
MDSIRGVHRMKGKAFAQDVEAIASRGKGSPFRFSTSSLYKRRREKDRMREKEKRRERGKDSTEEEENTSRVVRPPYLVDEGRCKSLPERGQCSP